MSLLKERFEEVAPLAQMEVQLARAALAARGRLDDSDEATLRYALSLARAWQVRAPDGRDVAVAALLRPLRRRVLEVLWPLLDPARPVIAQPHELFPAAREMGKAAAAARAEALGHLSHRLPEEWL
ncbi:MAG TPA: patatin-like phospholipase family protein, partial [Myxococcales bacterium]|nr:patatin-like phospholipase family protein [Myxococcales bacterium]